MRFMAILMVLVFFAQSASSDIVRGCPARIDVRNLPAGSFSSSVLIMELDASGTCSGLSTANNCRVLARLALLECIDALWAERNTHQIPSACQPDFDDSNRVNWTRFPGIYATLPGGGDSWIDRVRHEACCNSAQVGEVTVSIEWSIYGGIGCSGRPTDNFASPDIGSMHPSYTIDCTRQRARGICGPMIRTNPSD